MPDYYENRFELMIFDDFNIIEDIEEKKKEKRKRESKLEQREIEKNGICQGCEKKENEENKLRWVRDGEFYSCYACFIHDLECESSVMVPMRGADQMKDYLEEWEWEELWEYDK